LQNASVVDLKLIEIAAGSRLHLPKSADRQILLLSGRLNIEQAGKSHWLHSRNQLRLNPTHAAHLTNPDETVVEALILSCGQPAGVFASARHKKPEQVAG